jgi:molecular chaperone DnaK
MGRDNLTLAAKDAGFKKIQLVDEQISSILYFYNELANDKNDEENEILVFDLGGGTLDISYVSKKKNNYDVLFSDGDEHFGGDNFD